MTRKITVVITSFNNSTWLKECVESVARQTMPVDEIIIADDASTDGSQDLIQSLAAIHPQIRPILRETNIGVAANRDLAVREASGELITTLDSDDYYYPEKIEKEHLALTNSPAYSVAYSGFNRVYPEHLNRDPEPVEIPNFPNADKNKFILYFLFRAGALPRDMMMPKQLFIQVGGFRHKQYMYEDWDIKMRLARDATRWEYSGITGIAHRHHDASLSESDPLTHLKWMITVIFNNREWLESRYGQRVIYNAIARRVQLLPRPIQ